MGITKAICLVIRAFEMSRLSLAVEILALRQRVAVSQPKVAAPRPPSVPVHRGHFDPEEVTQTSAGRFLP